MSSTETKVVVGCAHVGSRKALSEKLTLCYELHDFASLPKKRGVKVETPSLPCHGYSWRLQVYPGGLSASNDYAYMSVFLERDCDNDNFEPNAQFSISMGAKKRDLLHKFTSSSKIKGWPDFVKRSEVLDPNKGYLVDGTLLVEVDIQVYLEKKPVWFPKESREDVMQQIMEASEWTDVTFVIGEERFPAHRCILAVRAPTLCELVQGADTEVVLSNMKPTIFRALLRFIYVCEFPDTVAVRSDGQGLLEAADRFGCRKLKLYVESAIVDSVLTKDNAAEWLLFAESHSCALLKEAVIELFASHPKAVMESPGWDAVAESGALLAGLMESLCCKRRNETEEIDIADLDVTTLRQKLEEKGLDVDGTREMLVQRLAET